MVPLQSLGAQRAGGGEAQEGEAIRLKRGMEQRRVLQDGQKCVVNRFVGKTAGVSPRRAGVEVGMPLRTDEKADQHFTRLSYC